MICRRGLREAEDEQADYNCRCEIEPGHDSPSVDRTECGQKQFEPRASCRFNVILIAVSIARNMPLATIQKTVFAETVESHLRHVIGRRITSS